MNRFLLLSKDNFKGFESVGFFQRPFSLYDGDIDDCVVTVYSPHQRTDLQVRGVYALPL